MKTEEEKAREFEDRIRRAFDFLHRYGSGRIPPPPLPQPEQAERLKKLRDFWFAMQSEDRLLTTATLDAKGKIILWEHKTAGRIRDEDILEGDGTAGGTGVSPTEHQVRGRRDTDGDLPREDREDSRGNES